jgi:hypothetical protein
MHTSTYDRNDKYLNVDTFMITYYAPNLYFKNFKLFNDSNREIMGSPYSTILGL